MPSFAKSTNRLGLGGLAPAIAKNVQGGAEGGADDFAYFCLPLCPCWRRGEEPFSRPQLPWTVAGGIPGSSGGPDWGRC